MSKTEIDNRVAANMDLLAADRSLGQANGIRREFCREAAATLRRVDAENKALRERLEASAVVPFGFALVPVEPTKEMVAAACRDHGYPGGSRSAYVLGYRSMLAAAPQAAAKTGDAA